MPYAPRRDTERGQSRTPVASFNGTLKNVKAPQLGIAAFTAALKQANVQPDQIEEVYLGNVLQAGVGQSPARQVLLGAGCPDTTEATTINKVRLPLEQLDQAKAVGQGLCFWNESHHPRRSELATRRQRRHGRWWHGKHV